MKILSTGSNYVHAIVGRNEIIFSYNVPVYFYDRVNQVKLINRYSKTTSSHISKCTGTAAADLVKDGWKETPIEEIKNAIEKAVM